MGKTQLVRHGLLVGRVEMGSRRQGTRLRDFTQFIHLGVKVVDIRDDFGVDIDVLAQPTQHRVQMGTSCFDGRIIFLKLEQVETESAARSVPEVPEVLDDS